MTEFEDRLAHSERQSKFRAFERLHEADGKLIELQRVAHYYYPPAKKKSEDEPSWKTVVWYMILSAITAVGFCYLIIWRSGAL